MQRSVIFALSAAAFVALVPVACTQDFGSFEPTDGVDSSGGSGSISSSTSSSVSASASASSGSGGDQQCTSSGMCDDGNPCTSDGCNLTAHTCFHTKRSGSAPGIDDNNPCTEDACSNGSVQHNKLPTGQGCGLNVVCNAAGRCVECLTEDQCGPAPECQIAVCTNFQCDVENEVVGTSCGNGNTCDGDGACVQCVGDGDCKGPTKCSNGVCVPDNCKNSKKDGGETDVDCGGPACPKCAAGKACVNGTDCLSGACPAGVCT